MGDPMDSLGLLEHLEQAERDLAEAWARADAQEQRIADLKEAGRSTAEATHSFRCALKVAQLFEQHRDRLKALVDFIEVLNKHAESSSERQKQAATDCYLLQTISGRSIQ